LSEVVKNRRHGGRIRVEHSAPVSHELPMIEAGFPSGAAFDESAGTPEPGALRHMPMDAEEAALAAYRRGRDEGIAEGERRAEAALTSRRDRDRASAAALASAVQEQFSLYAGRLEKEAFRFALAVAGRILRREVTLDEEAVLRQVKEAFHRVIGAETVTLRIHPLDEPLLRERKNEMLGSSDSVREVIIEPDEAVERGGCIIESPSGNIDARLATQLAQIESALFGNGGHSRTNG